MQILLALVAKLFEVLLRVLLIPQFKEWQEKRKRDKELKDLAKKNQAKGEAYENAGDVDTARDAYRKLP